MTSELQIENFKKITREIILQELSTVNYFVGKNGSGKSSILNAITYLGNPNDASNSRHFFNANSVVKLTINPSNAPRVNQLVWNDENPNKVAPVFEANLFISLDGEQPEMGANGILRATVNYQQDAQGKDSIAFLNETLNILELPEIKVQRIIANDDPWDDNVGKRIFTQNDVIINPFMLAKGIQAFNSFRFHLQQLLNLAGNPDQADAFMVVMEEIDNDLHPDLQKKIPLFIDNLITGLDERLRNKIQFFVSTHSPFVVGKAAEYPDQKIYIVDNGLFKDLEGNFTEKSSGFKGSTCAWVVGQMLGAEISDLGYPENYCIIEEYSLFVILEDCKRKGVIKNYQFISAGGESKIIGLTERFNSFMQVNTLVKCNPYYYDKYLVIVDSTEDFNAKQKERFKLLSSTLGNRFTELSKHGLEDYYQNISPELSEKFFDEFKQLKGDHLAQGLKKTEFANYVAGLINSLYEFSKLFDKELDFLLK